MSDQPAGIPALPGVLPIQAMEAVVDDAFIDQNGHMSSANYFQVFQQGLSRLLRPLGFGDAYRARGWTIFQREAHIRYHRELRLGDEFYIRSWLVDYDERRLQHFHEMRKGQSGELVATIEYVTTNIDLATRRSAPFPEDVRLRLQQLFEAFGKAEPPASATFSINLGAGGKRPVLVS